MATLIPNSDTAELPGLLDVPALAAYLDVPVSTIYLWRTRGEGPRGFRVGKKVRFRIEDVRTWLDEQRTRDGADP